MKKKIIFGLSLILLIAVIGGSFIAVLMKRLEAVNRARYQVSTAYQALNYLEIDILRTVEDIRFSWNNEKRLRVLLDRVRSIKESIKSVRNDILTDQLAREACGSCHSRGDLKVDDMKNLLKGLEKSFDNLTFLASVFITRGPGVDEDKILQEMKSSLDEINALMDKLDKHVSPMIGHTDAKVNRTLAGIYRAQDLVAVFTVLLILAGFVILVRVITRPFNLLTRGTEAIVNGDYNFRVSLTGDDEMVLLAHRFNTMAEVVANREMRLNEKKRELEELNESLEKNVRGRTEDLRGKRRELNRKFLELESTNEELQASYIQLQSTAAELEEAQARLQENYDILKEMNRELQRANEVKNKFLSIMSHELRTPLTVINGYLSLILDKNYGEPSSVLKEILVVIKEQAKNQLGLIEELLDLTRIEAGEFRLNRQPCDIEALLGKVIEGFVPKFEEKGITASLDVAKDLPQTHWDYQKVLQVFQNLVDNSLKFTPAGGWLAISAVSKSDFIEIRVSDNGIGIPGGNIDQVFDRFYQVDSSSTRMFGGSGLGLSIVREIVLAHKGKIFVESQEGEGATFLVLLPVGLPERSQHPVRDVGRDENGADETPHIPGGNGELILVVDDDPAFLRMMETILPREGYRVKVSERPGNTLEQVKKAKVDIVLLDLMMPGMDGYDVCRKLRRDPDTSHVPILIVSASGGDEISRKINDAGADDHLTKPFDQQDILNRISALLSNRPV